MLAGQKKLHTGLCEVSCVVPTGIPACRQAGNLFTLKIAWINLKVYPSLLGEMKFIL